MTDPRGRHVTLQKPQEPEDPESMHHGGSFKKYMQFKNTKLREQYQAEKQGEETKSKLFSGISIHVNGYTEPTHQELRQIMAAHGGNFEVYYFRSTVTHIICSNLPNAKIKALEKERTSTPIVRPEWIVDSLKEGRVLPHQNYSLWRLRDKPGQSTLGAFQAQPVSRSSTLHQPTGANSAKASHQPASVPIFSPAKTTDIKTTPAASTFCVPDTPAAEIAGQDGGGPAHEMKSSESPRADDQLQTGNGMSLQGMNENDKLSVGNWPNHSSAVQRGEGTALLQTSLHGLQQFNAEDRATEAQVLNQNGQETPAEFRAHTGDEDEPARGPGLLHGQSNAHDCAGASSSHANKQEVETGGEMGWQSSVDDAETLHTNKATGHPPKSGMQLQGNLQRAQQVAAKCRAACDLLKGAPKSSREDPKFMDNYYKSSRLHFIGTWKARIEALAMQTREPMEGPKVGLPKGQKRQILHLDMDCFFASAAALEDPSLKGLPLLVCHSNSAQGTGEVSSANYEARAFGIRADMTIGEAKRLCPDLVVMPYQYDKYQTISEQVYKILLQITSKVQPISCDEAYVDITGLGDPLQIAQNIRSSIFKATGCSASAGISHNLLLARLATKSAKPNGQHLLAEDQVEKHLLQLEVSSLPGVGWSTRQKLSDMGIQTVTQLRLSSEALLKAEFGAKNGSTMWAAAHGQDEREVEPVKLRRSVGAEVNWGIRFTCEQDAHDFLDGIAGEVHARMVEAGVKGRSISLKIKRRKSNAPEPYKFLGHGPCDNVSRSVTLNRATDATQDLASEARTLLIALRIPATQIRGIGISVSKLDNDAASSAGISRQGALPKPAAAASRFRPRTPNLMASPNEDYAGYHGPSAQPPEALPKGARQLQFRSPEDNTIFPEQEASLLADRSLKEHINAEAKSHANISVKHSHYLDSPDDAQRHKPAKAMIDSFYDVDDEGQHAAGNLKLSTEPAFIPESGTSNVMLQQSQGIEPRQVQHKPEEQESTVRLDGNRDDLEFEAAGKKQAELRTRDLAALRQEELTTDLEVHPSPARDLDTDLDLEHTLRDQLEEDNAAAVQQQARVDDADYAEVDPDWPANVNRIMQMREQAEMPSIAGQLSSLQGPSKDLGAQVVCDTRVTTPIQALPPASQIDASVLDALPLHMKREIERAYGVGRARMNNAGVKRRRGSGRPIASSRPIKRAFTSTNTVPQRPTLDADGNNVDLAILKELPIEVQQEVADNLTRNRALETSKPIHQSSFVQFPAPDPMTTAPKKVPREPVDSFKDVWPKFAQAFADLAEDLRPHSGSEPALKEHELAAVALDDASELLVDYGQSLVADDLESVQQILREVLQLEQRYSQLARWVRRVAELLQSLVAEEWDGLHLAMTPCP